MPNTTLARKPRFSSSNILLHGAVPTKSNAQSTPPKRAAQADSTRHKTRVHAAETRTNPRGFKPWGLCGSTVGETPCNAHVCRSSGGGRVGKTNNGSVDYSMVPMQFESDVLHHAVALSERERAAHALRPRN